MNNGTQISSSNPEELEMELSIRQIDRIDQIHEAVFDLCRALTENESLEWDIYYIGEIADMACEILNRCGYRIRYPAIVEEPDGSERIIEYYGEE